MIWRILITPDAHKMLSAISDRRIREKIISTIDRLIEEPEKQGKALVGDLAGLRSIRAVGQRYRVIYKLIDDQVIVAVVAVGIRRGVARDDVYQLAKKLIKLRLVDN